MLATGRAHSRLRRQRAVAFLWFCILTVPVLFFTAGMTIDFTRIIVANREATNLADSAAVAGAYRYVAGQAYLDQTAARNDAIDTWNVGTNASGNAAPLVNVTKNPAVTFDGPVGKPTEITVTVEYTVDGLLFIDFFSNFRTGGAPTGDNTSLKQKVSASAFVCVPGSAGYTDGYCVRPEFRNDNQIPS